MHLEATVVVCRPPATVWSYLGDISNVPSWDRGVAQVQQTSPNAPGVGFEFDTLAHPRGADGGGEWGKMSYVIADADPLTELRNKLVDLAQERPRYGCRAQKVLLRHEGDMVNRAVRERFFALGRFIMAAEPPPRLSFDSRTLGLTAAPSRPNLLLLRRRKESLGAFSSDLYSSRKLWLSVAHISGARSGGVGV